MFDYLYNAMLEDMTVFGDKWCGPARLEHGKDTLIAQYPKDPPDGDGYPVDVYCCAMPARFYKIVAHPSRNSVDESKNGFTIGTGSIDCEFVAQLAKSISQGMFVVDSLEVPQ